MLRSLPRLRNNPEGNRLIVAAMQAKGTVNIQRGEVVTAYQNGDIDATEARQRLSTLNSQSILPPELKAMIGGDGEISDASSTGATAQPDAPEAPIYATNPATGERLILRSGQWEPAT